MDLSQWNGTLMGTFGDKKALLISVFSVFENWFLIMNNSLGS